MNSEITKKSNLIKSLIFKCSKLINCLSITRRERSDKDCIFMQFVTVIALLFGRELAYHNKHKKRNLSERDMARPKQTLYSKMHSSQVASILF